MPHDEPSPSCLPAPRRSSRHATQRVPGPTRFEGTTTPGLLRCCRPWTSNQRELKIARSDLTCQTPSTTTIIYKISLARMHATHKWSRSIEMVTGSLQVGIIGCRCKASNQGMSCLTLAGYSFISSSLSHPIHLHCTEISALPAAMFKPSAAISFMHVLDRAAGCGQLDRKRNHKLRCICIVEDRTHPS
jgi:hypothetical protein